MQHLIPPMDEVYSCLDQLIVRDECILAFDYSLVEQLPDILAENYGIVSAVDVLKHPVARRLFELLDPSSQKNFEPETLPNLLSSSGLDLKRYDTGVSRSAIDDSSRYVDFTTATCKEGPGAVETIKAMQSSLGQGKQEGGRYPAHKGSPEELHLYLESVSSVRRSKTETYMNSHFWGILLEGWKYQGFIDPETPSLSVGPRWLTEIMYFRQMHDLPKHIGLDLFSDDPSLVVAGDMHKMPFPDSYFSFVFLKNVIDKSYNARVLIRELIRVVRPGGIVICDNDCSYGVTDPLGRTDIQKSANLFRAFKARSFVVPLICKDYDTPQSRSRRVVRLAMRIFKSGTGQLAA